LNFGYALTDCPAEIYGPVDPSAAANQYQSVPVSPSSIEQNQQQYQQQHQYPPYQQQPQYGHASEQQSPLNRGYEAQLVKQLAAPFQQHQAAQQQHHQQQQQHRESMTMAELHGYEAGEVEAGDDRDRANDVHNDSDQRAQTDAAWRAEQEYYWQQQLQQQQQQQQQQLQPQAQLESESQQYQHQSQQPPHTAAAERVHAEDHQPHRRRPNPLQTEDASFVLRSHSPTQYAGGSGDGIASKHPNDLTAALALSGTTYQRSPGNDYESSISSSAAGSGGVGSSIGGVGSSVGGAVDESTVTSLLTHDINTLDRTQLEYLLEQFQPDQHKAPIRYVCLCAFVCVWRMSCFLCVFTACGVHVAGTSACAPCRLSRRVVSECVQFVAHA
jgi:hypothetical protein